MKYLLVILEKFSAYFRSKSNLNSPKDSLNKNNEYIGGICFQLTKNFDIDIIGFIPESKNLDAEELVYVAEKYAQLILAINKGYLKNKIMQILENRSNQTEEPNEQLLINNILVFYDVLKKELANKIVNSNSPLIRPLSAFKPR